MSSNKGAIYVISGPSGSGKNTVFDGLNALTDNVSQTVSVTTRPPRSDEINGKDYYFVSKEEFLKKVEADEFIEYVKYGENYYGTLKSEVERLVNIGKNVILVIEVQGAGNIKKAFPEATTIFLLPPSIDELRKRIVGRGENTDDEVNLRISIAFEEMKLKDNYDYQVVNDDLDICIKEVYKIICEKSV